MATRFARSNHDAPGAACSNAYSAACTSFDQSVTMRARLAAMSSPPNIPNTAAALLEQPESLSSAAK